MLQTSNSLFPSSTHYFFSPPLFSLYLFFSPRNLFLFFLCLALLLHVKQTIREDRKFLGEEADVSCRISHRMRNLVFVLFFSCSCSCFPFHLRNQIFSRSQQSEVFEHSHLVARVEGAANEEPLKGLHHLPRLLLRRNSPVIRATPSWLGRVEVDADVRQREPGLKEAGQPEGQVGARDNHDVEVRESVLVERVELGMGDPERHYVRAAQLAHEMAGS
mmetsp:Transcript_7922/g.18055  ORF Transcript_7922/g.18055 Transcript_7922/m.18055 type:complete len:218 (-) Transcript_7922:317-970(-)